MDTVALVFLVSVLSTTGRTNGHNSSLYGVFHKASSQKIFNNVLKTPNIKGNSISVSTDINLFGLISVAKTAISGLNVDKGNDKFIFTDFTGVKENLLREALERGGSDRRIHFDSRLNGKDKVASHILVIDKLLSLVDSINTPPKKIFLIIDDTELGHVSLSWILQKSIEVKRKISFFHIITENNMEILNMNLSDLSDSRVVIVDTNSVKAAKLLHFFKDLGLAGFHGMFQWYFTERAKESLSRTCSRPSGHYFGLQIERNALLEKYILDTVLQCKNDPETQSILVGCKASYQSINQVNAFQISSDGDIWIPVEDITDPLMKNYNIPGEDRPLWPRLRVSISLTYEPWIHIIDLKKTEVSDRLCGMDGKFGYRFANKSSAELIPICAYGLSIDILKYFEEKLEFIGVMTVSRDGLYGTYREEGGKISGILKDIYEDQADIGLDLMEDSERNKVVDFTTPVLISSGGIAYIQRGRYNSSIFGPFGLVLWMSILGCIAAVAIFIWFLERVSQYGRHRHHVQQRAPGEEDEPFDAVESMNYIWGIFLIGEIIKGKPRSVGSRISVIAFAFVSILILAAYSANLIAFLVVMDEKPLITGIDDPKLLNDDSKITGGLIKSTSVSDGLQFSHNKRMRKLFKRMKTFNGFSEALQALRTGKIQVLMADSFTLKHKASLDHECEIRVIPLKNSERGIGTVFKKNSMWKTRFNLAVTHLRSSGTVDKLFRVWFQHKECVKSVNFFQLSINEMGTLFIILSAGIACCLITSLVLYIFKNYQSRRNQKYVPREH